MKITETPLAGAFVIEPEPLKDERGYFARTYCQNFFQEHKLNHNWVQQNISFNEHKGTLRGLHFQNQPHGEIKLVWCAKGSLFDVIVDLRPNSETYMKWFGIELSDANQKMLYIPEDFAHGFITLQEQTLVHYQMSEFYHPESARTISYQDPDIGITWPPFNPLHISNKDKEASCWSQMTAH